MLHFVRLSRPHFLLGGVLLHALGAVAAGLQDWAAFLVGQGMVTTAQVTAHYVNEYADIEADRLVANRTMFSGGSGVLSSDLLSPAVALRAALVTSAAAVAFAVAVAPFSPIASFVGLAALAISWSYSLPPVRLLDTGWGELATTTVVTVAVPLIGSLAQDGSPDPAFWWHLAALAAIHLAMMLVFELPDLESDRAAGKTVLAVRIGRRATTLLIGLLLATPALIGPLAIAAGMEARDQLWVTGATVVAAAATVAAIIRERHGIATLTAVLTLITYASGVLAAI